MVWHPGDTPSGNLGGTISSWNEVSPSSIPGTLGPGLLSRDGWTLVDDSATPRFSNATDPTARFLGKAPWVDPRSYARRTASDLPLAADWYFFGCGLDYRACVADFSGLSGPIAIPPQAAFGVWWSHYETYSEVSIQTEVLAGFQTHSLPLNVLQMDCGWHGANAEKDPRCSAYNAYDWNTELFPDPRAYVATVHTGNPTDPRSYADQYLYMVGDDVLVRPVVNPIAANATAGAVDVAVWLPSVRGSAAAGWVEWNSSVLHAGGATVTVAATLSDLPLFVRAGAVLPLLPADCLDVTDPTATIWILFPGAEAGDGSRYWDDGASTAYADTAASATQRLTYRWDDAHAVLTCVVAAANVTGGFSLPTAAMHWHSVELRGGPFTRATTATFNGVAGRTVVVATHSLPTPIGTVLVTSPTAVALSDKVTIVITV